MFIGEYSHTIDAKGRLIIPSKFREELGDNFVVTKGLDGCLFVYTKEEWNLLHDRLKGLPLTNSNTRRLNRFFLASASNGEIDKQGRVLVPAVLREFAKIEKDVVLIGVGNRIEIWDKVAWENGSNYSDMDDIAEQMAELGFQI